MEFSQEVHYHSEGNPVFTPYMYMRTFLGNDETEFFTYNFDKEQFIHTSLKQIGQV